MLLLLMACAGDPPEPDATDTRDITQDDTASVDTATEDTGAIPPEDTAPYLDGDAENQPSLTLQQQEDALQSALDFIAGIDPQVPHDLYTGVMDNTDNTCPAFIDEFTWYDSCTTRDGVDFEGYGSAQRYTDFSDSGNTYNFYDALVADALLSAGPYELLFRTEGSWHADWYDGDGVRFFDTFLDGEFGWTDPDQDTGWLASYPRITLTQSAARLDDLFFNNLSGTLTSLDGAASSIIVEDLYFISPDLGADCTDEPGGIVSLQADDEWYIVVFHGPDSETLESSGACDGCGDVYFEGTLQGSVCPDFTPYTDWEDRPW